MDEQMPTLNREHIEFLWRVLNRYGDHAEDCPRARHRSYAAGRAERGECACGFDALRDTLRARRRAILIRGVK